MIAIVLTVRMALSMPRSPGDTPKSTGSVSLMIIRYVRHPPYAITIMLIDTK